jgi:hypothetical protein
MVVCEHGKIGAQGNVKLENPGIYESKSIPITSRSLFSVAGLCASPT